MKKNSIITYFLLLQTVVYAESGDYIQIPVASTTENPVAHIKIFAQFQDEFLKNKAVVFPYNKNDMLITTTPLYDQSKYIVIDDDTGIFFTLDQVAKLLKNPNDTFIYPYKNKKTSKYSAVTHRSKNDNTNGLMTPSKTQTPYIYVYGSKNIYYRGMPFDYGIFVLTTKPGTLANNSSIYKPDEILTSSDIAREAKSPVDLAKNNILNFFINYQSPNNKPNVRMYRRMDGKKERRLPEKWDHNDIVVVAWKNCWFTFEDLYEKLINKLYFTKPRNEDFIFYVNYNAWFSQ